MSEEPPKAPETDDVAAVSAVVVVLEATPPQPGLFTETHAVPVAETVPMGVSAPTPTEALVCVSTGTGAETAIVSDAVVVVPVVARSVCCAVVGCVSVTCVTVLAGSDSDEVPADASVVLCVAPAVVPDGVSITGAVRVAALAVDAPVLVVSAASVGLVVVEVG